MDNKEINQNYIAFYMPEDREEKMSRKGFKSIAEAEKYISKHLCKPNCKECRAEWILTDTKTFGDYKDIPEIKETKTLSNKKIRSSYKRIKSVLYSLAHSFFSMMNEVDRNAAGMNAKDIIYHMDDFVSDVMKKNDIGELKIYFSKRKVFPGGAYSQAICKSVDYYMKWLPKLAESQDVDSRKIKNITSVIKKQAESLKISIAATDDRGMRHIVQLR